MASLRKTGGRWLIQFSGADKRRRTLRLGAIAKRDAETVQGHVEQIISSSFAGAAIPDETARWLGKIPEGLHDKLAAVGLVTERERAILGEFLDAFIASRPVKESTTITYGHARRCLVEYFGKNKALRDISPGDCDDWRQWLKTNESLAEATINRRCGVAKQFFRAAVRKRLIPENPFDGMKGLGDFVNRERDYFLSRSDAAKILEACPDADWRLIFALSRFGGLRCPSEHLALTWQDIDWARNRFTVTSPKTEHHDGGESRVVPIFPELRPYLEASFHAAEPGLHVIAKARSPKKNFRTMLRRIIKRAGLTPWPRLFQNLRASRATELAAEHPAHVAAAWLGHSTTIAQKHYWQVTDADFEQAIGEKKATQNPTHSLLEIDGNASQVEKVPVANTSKKTAFPEDSYVSQKWGMGGTGLEPIQQTHGKTPFSETSDVKSDAIHAGNDPGLAEIIEAWPGLPEETRAALLAIVRGNQTVR